MCAQFSQFPIPLDVNWAANQVTRTPASTATNLLCLMGIGFGV